MSTSLVEMDDKQLESNEIFNKDFQNSINRTFKMTKDLEICYYKELKPKVFTKAWLTDQLRNINMANLILLVIFIIITAELSENIRVAQSENANSLKYISSLSEIRGTLDNYVQRLNSFNIKPERIEHYNDVVVSLLSNITTLEKILSNELRIPERLSNLNDSVQILSSQQKILLDDINKIMSSYDLEYINGTFSGSKNVIIPFNNCKLRMRLLFTMASGTTCTTNIIKYKIDGAEKLSLFTSTPFLDNDEFATGNMLELLFIPCNSDSYKYNVKISRFCN